MAKNLVAPSGELKMKVMRGEPGRVSALREIITDGLPSLDESDLVNRWRAANMRNLWRGARRVLVARAMGVPHFYGSLRGVLITPNEQIDLGLMSLRVVTTAGVNKLVAGLNATDTTTYQNFKYHGFGTGSTAEAIGDTALVTELTTQYSTDNTRPTGTQTVGATNNIYRTVATLSPDAGGTLNITEHGVFSATSGGTLLDRTVFTAVPLVAGSDSLQVTYELTLTAGS